MNYKLQVVAKKTKLFKNAICPESLNEALTIAKTKGITTNYINEYFDSKPKQFQILHIIKKPYYFTIQAI
jgi:nitrogen regulatory protein PII-like uncharacterized protein